MASTIRVPSLRIARSLPWIGAVMVSSATVVATFLGWMSSQETLVVVAASGFLAVLARMAQQRTEAVLGAEIARRRDAEHAARRGNRAKTEFLANMSHELRTPLGTVIGTADLLRSTSLAAEERRQLEVIDTSAQMLLGLIDDILDFAKLEAGHLRLDSLDYLLRDVVQDVHRVLAPQAAEKELTTEVVIAQNLPDALHGDPARIRQVLLNLYGNAIKFTPHGRVGIRIEREEGEDSGSWVCFFVDDTGLGIAAKDQERVFDTFIQADSSSARAFGGSGLGLAISKELVARMDGHIDFESQRGKGSTFWFQLPLIRAKGTVLVVKLRAPIGGRARGLGRRVLVVDDHPTNRNLALAHLKILGYQAAGAASGNDALARLADTPFDAVLMDCQMPEMNGYETARRIRQRQRKVVEPRMPIIAVTASAMPNEREKCLAVGMDDYVTKPYRGAELGEVLRRWLGERLADVEPPCRDDLPNDRIAERIEAFRRLAENTGDDVLEQVVGSYLAQVPQALERMRRAADKGDAEALVDAAHALAGSSGTIGATQLAGIASTIEKRARLGELVGAAEAVDDAERAFRRCEPTLRVSIESPRGA